MYEGQQASRISGAQLQSAMGSDKTVAKRERYIPAAMGRLAAQASEFEQTVEMLHKRLNEGGVITPFPDPPTNEKERPNMPALAAGINDAAIRMQYANSRLYNLLNALEI